MSDKDYNPPMHTVEHLLNGVLSSMLGCQRAFSTHIEKKKSKIDYHFNRDLREEEITEAENYVNKAISASVDVREEFVSFDEARVKYNVSRLPSDVGDDIRVVHIGEFDSCVCIGEHVPNTSQIDGILKIISSDYKPDEGVLRVRFKIIK